MSYELVKRLSESGEFEIDVVTMGYKDLPRYEELNPQLRVHRVPCLRSKKELSHPWEQATYLVSAYFKARGLLKKQTYDICHCHFIIPTGFLALKLKNEFGLPYILTAHGSDVLGYNQRFRHLYPFLVGSWKKILLGAQVLISPSQFLKQEVLKVFPAFSTQSIQVIPNGFDPATFAPKEKKKWIFSSGRLLINKGFQYLIQAVSEKDIGYEVHIAGDGPMRQELETLAKKSKTPIIFYGWLENKSGVYRDLLESSAIYVLASEKENASISLLEAMAAGCAVITTNATGCAETVGSAGALFTPNNDKELAQRIEELVLDPKKLQTLQHEARERIQVAFDWDLVISKYRTLL